MKKILALSVALALIGSAAFAEGLVLSGKVSTGLEMAAETDSSYKARVYSDEAHSGNTPLRFDLDGAWSNETAGVKFKLRTQFRNSADISSWDEYDYAQNAGSYNKTAGDLPFFTGDGFIPSIRGVYGYANFLNGLVRVDGGKFHDNLWGNSNVSRFIEGKNLEDNLTGARLSVKPIEGLSFGLVLGLPDWAIWGGAADAKYLFYNGAVGAKYASDIFTGSVGYRFGPHSDFEDDYGIYNPGGELIFDVKVAPITSLTLDLQGHIAKLGADINEDTGGNSDKDKSRTVTKLGFDATYKISDALSAGLEYNATIKDAGIDEKEETKVSFASKFVPHVNVVFNDTFSLYSEIGYALTPVYDKINDETATNHELGLFASLSIKAGKNATVKIMDAFTPLSTDVNRDVAGSEFNHIKNTTQLEFIYTF